ncbi:MAG: mannose-1-phosphate guanylyltransferase/mannose-6-phosphate isomerase [Pseudomonadota bacterium]
MLAEKIKNVVPVILCGGSGTRLWPVSRRDYPKQFINFTGEHTLFQETLLRIQAVFEEDAVIITNNSMKFLVCHQLQQIHCKAQIIAEPSAQNSGPAVLLSALHAQTHFPEHLVAVFASDHVISGLNKFHNSISNALPAADLGNIVTFGITPSEPSTAYGYIAKGKTLSGTEAAKIDKFVEKPDVETAKNYLEQGYVWNSGNFIFAPKTLIDEYKKSDTDTYNAVQEALTHASDDMGMIIPSEHYKDAKSLSIDYAVMEKTEHAAVVTADFTWSDAGTWKSLYDIAEKDDNGNAIYGGHVVTTESVKNCLIHNASQRLIAVSQMDDTSVIATEDAIFVSHKDNAADVKSVIETLKEQGRTEAVTPSRVYRPWGWYESISNGDRYQVKRITVYPEASLSLQKHFHRAEHWVVVRGIAEVVNGDKILKLSENQSTYIPREAVHRLTNIGKDDLQLIEVQSGSYLGEDDIVRLEDIYNRS